MGQPQLLWTPWSPPGLPCKEETPESSVVPVLQTRAALGITEGFGGKEPLKVTKSSTPQGAHSLLWVHLNSVTVTQKMAL